MDDPRGERMKEEKQRLEDEKQEGRSGMSGVGRQTYEPHLFKMLVKTGNFFYAVLFHEDHGGTIGETPLVGVHRFCVPRSGLHCELFSQYCAVELQN